MPNTQFVSCCSKLSAGWPDASTMSDGGLEQNEGWVKRRCPTFSSVGCEPDSCHTVRLASADHSVRVHSTSVLAPSRDMRTEDRRAGSSDHAFHPVLSLYLEVGGRSISLEVKRRKRIQACWLSGTQMCICRRPPGSVHPKVPVRVAVGEHGGFS